jgi:hypothetical protein
MFKGIIPGPEQLSKKAIMTAIMIPEGIVMLTIAIMLDGAGIILFVLSLIGVGIPISFLLTILGSVTIGLWALLRPMLRGLVSKATEETTSKMFNVGGGLEGIREFQGSSAPAVEAGKKVAKKGIKFSLSATRFIISFVIKMIPFLGNIFPAWTFLVIFELVQGEI